jgi:MFS transporter, DHA1 family, inner membrane transport protein
MPDQGVNIEARVSMRGLAPQIAIATLARFCINTARRFVYPFAPAMSRGLGVPLVAVTSLIAVNQATGLLSPLFGPLSDRWGYRAMLLVAIGLLGAGMLLGALVPVYSAILIALFLAGLAKSIFDPALQAYVGERVPYQRRGLVIGVIALSWSGSSLVGIPIMGLLIERVGWRAPFLALAVLSALALIALGLLIPARYNRQQHASHNPGFRNGWRQLRANRMALGGLGFGFLVSMANDNLFVVYGAWLEEAFTLSLVALGAATTVIGVAEMLGEMLTASVADRLGLKRALAAGVCLATLAYACLPLVGQTLPLALLGLFLVFLSFEFGVVTAISLFTEVLPGARATMMSAFLAVMSMGRVAGALLGGPVWLSGGFLATGTVSAVLNGLALLCLLWGWYRPATAKEVA